jgi:hypothetical protein
VPWVDRRSRVGPARGRGDGVTLKTKPPRRGHAITALALDGGLLWLHVDRVVRNRIDTYYATVVRLRDSFSAADTLAQFPLLVSSEGLTWCYGHVTDKNEAAAAMLASAAMR